MQTHSDRQTDRPLYMGVKQLCGQSCPWVGLTHGLGLVGSGWIEIFQFLVGWVGLGWIGSHKVDPWTTLGLVSLRMHLSVLPFFLTLMRLRIGADFRFEVPGQSSVGLIGGGRGQWLGGTMASAEHEPIMGVWGQSPQRGPGAEQSPWSRGSGGLRPPEAESILVIGCPTEPANLAPLVKFSK